MCCFLIVVRLEDLAEVMKRLEETVAEIDQDLHGRTFSIPVSTTAPISSVDSTPSESSDESSVDEESGSDPEVVPPPRKYRKLNSPEVSPLGSPSSCFPTEVESSPVHAIAL